MQANHYFHTSTTADDTTLVSVHKNTKEASKLLRNQIVELKKLLKFQKADMCTDSFYAA